MRPSPRTPYQCLPVEPKPPPPRPVSESAATTSTSTRDDRRDDQLRDAVAAPDLERLLAEVDEDHAHLATVVLRRWCPGAFTIPMPWRTARPGARAHLALVPGRQLERRCRSGTRRRSPGASVHASSARRSSPAAPSLW